MHTRLSAPSARRRRVRRPLGGSGVAAVLAASLVSCSSAPNDPVTAGSIAATEATAGLDESPVAAGDEADVFTESDDSGDPDPGDGLGPVPPPLPTGTVSDSVVDPIEPVPDTGVPGIESTDEFCRSWSEFAGSYQALTFAWAVRGGESAARLEVLASDALTSAVEGLRSTLPAELEIERQALTVDLPGPLLRRAERSREYLVASGLDDATITLLGARWLAAVTESGLESDDLTVPLDDPALDDAVAAASARFFSELPPIVEDPSLIVDVQIPATEAYLFDNCPDRGILAGNDNVDI